ncbi:hypothetical protein C884_02239 [Kocuria palustris PEL]|uniref:Uncharacterized protein n=1 Tax=Kocuria palustris PEL TaxID=1236550 RepID=M2XW93_9MICC|nr:hypothetical protein C884_02239 [Kocuria palustris PEL]
MHEAFQVASSTGAPHPSSRPRIYRHARRCGNCDTARACRRR